MKAQFLISCRMLTATAQYMYLEYATFSIAQQVIVIVIN